ncbi:hypothetical protein SAMN02910377_00654 [Pseudobutyrivibrio ruminis]|uniref:Uncharacterized protein n=1 Tax=Pseudobutyrivibrio ruminis TaxID=46206 RepID=A0A1H7G7A8_9FIRM|nr:hypothetical protein [Pseudobutyrivibrio ruminis]SEK34029.1 hypothetical protein SAMN02910377_00654 [Pseudobutyrivibrio ruminis]
MKYLDYDFFENEKDEIGLFSEYLDKFEGLLKKGTYYQRVFLKTLREVVEADIDSEEWIYEELLFAGYIELYSRAPELIPNAPLEFMRKSLPNKKYRNEFQRMTDIMQYWADAVKSNRRPFNRIASKVSDFPEIVIYPVFVALLVGFFITGLTTIQALSIGISIGIIKYILILIATGFVSTVFAKAIVLKIELKYSSFL